MAELRLDLVPPILRHVYEGTQQGVDNGRFEYVLLITTHTGHLVEIRHPLRWCSCVQLASSGRAV